MKKEINNILLNAVSEEERVEYFTKLKEEPSDAESFNETFRLFALNNILFKKNSPSTKKDMFSRFWSIAQMKQTRVRNLIIIGQAAAILLFILYTGITLYSTINNTESYTLRSEKGSISSVTLTEGTKIWLNTSSSAEITKKGKNQIICNLNGEAYFEVEHNPNREFLVNVGAYRIRDIGTSFNIKAYPDENQIIVSMFDGLADLERSDNTLLKNMEGGEEVMLDRRSGKLSFSETNYLSDIDWKDGKFAFEKTPFSEIVKEFEEWYDVEFIIKNERVNSQLFSGVLKRKSSIENLMKILKLTTEFDYELKIENDGSTLIYIY